MAAAGGSVGGICGELMGGLGWCWPGGIIGEATGGLGCCGEASGGEGC